MKPMSERKMEMSRGEPDTDGFFPDSPHKRALPRAGEIRGIDYPDSDEDIHSDQEQAIRETNAARQKEGFRH